MTGSDVIGALVIATIAFLLIAAPAISDHRRNNRRQP